MILGPIMVTQFDEQGIYLYTETEDQLELCADGKDILARRLPDVPRGSTQRIVSLHPCKDGKVLIEAL